MKPYENRGHDSEVTAYDYDEVSISVRFRHGGVFRYCVTRIGAAHLAEMKRLADSGDGLNTYINKHPLVKKDYDSL